MIELIKYCIKFVVMIFEQFFDWQARNREADKQLKLDDASFKAMAVAALSKMLNQANTDSSLARDVEDAIDAEIRRRKENLPKT